MRILLVAALAGVLISCGGTGDAGDSPAGSRKAVAPKPTDESRRFPKANLVETAVVEKELLGKPFMPGGTIARYKKGKTEYEMFLAKLPDAATAAILLLDWQKALSGAKLNAGFGGYFGLDAKRPVFVFPKGAWMAGVAGLPEKEADAQARILASRME